jgi:hypothetical protein
MAMFLVVRLRSGPHWDASLPLEKQSDWPAHASFMDELVGTGFESANGVRRALDDQARRTPGVTERAENQHGVPALRLGGAT